ncbi:hypothetical protein PP744_gp098 [Rhizobium phage RHph_N38]|uniref:Uncharacterized protein n=1 Tax=Rhizobium phage RHph_N38 TaxID=2509750 RepID=A0A7S5R3M9_9CAUD|nr:hypothetical protein PP744_gp098 [Rhizobium phage RHph_N38]QIG70557.1 hypothetical protein EVB89_096 [Rhizobium phage RHph_N38]
MATTGSNKAVRSVKHAQEVEAALQFCARHKVGRPLVPAHILQTLVVELLYRKNIIHDLMTQVYPYQENLFVKSKGYREENREGSICSRQNEKPHT